MHNEDGHPTHNFRQLDHICMTYFEQLFKGPRGATLAEIIIFSIHFPHFLDQDEAVDLIKAISIRELHITLKSFIKDKIHGPNGWFI